MAEGYSVLHTSGGYAIVDPDGRVGKARYGNRAGAETRCENLTQALKDGKKKRRPCITCGTKILSDGPHHRMCNPCRTRSDDAPYVFGPRRGRAGVRS
ncbi:hypothetical protein [Sagittula sp. S175]|uniref:hypothetical protein n=1 Tax=Sagittula sp. S175 TaxID=3415129 RepID=UPI003C7D6CB2